MKKLPALVACALLLVGAHAQVSTPPTAPTPDAAKLALAREVITAMQADKLIDRMTGQMKQMAVQMTGLAPDMPADKRARAEAVQGKIMDLSMEMSKALIAKMDVIYADVFTEPELKVMKAFYSSPEGQSSQLKQAEVAQRLMPAMQEMQRSLMPKIQQIMAEAQAEEAKAAAAATAAPTPESTPAAKSAEPAK
jgi:hypothetical protein